MKVTTAHRCRRPAYTLVELAATAAISGIIVVGIASAMVVGTKALPERQTSTNTVISSSQAAEQISNELHYAQSILTKTANNIRFTVPDRNGDNVTDTIEYSWSGTAGDPLIRKFNAEADEEILENVNEFQMTYECKTKTIPGVPGGNVESAEMQFINQDSTNSGTAATSGITSLNWCSQYFRPTFAAEALSWRITKVKILPTINGTSDGKIRVQIRPRDFALRPTTTVLEEVTLNESTFVSGQWATATFSNVSNLVVASGYCVVIRYDSGSNTVANIAYGTSSSLSTATHFIVSTNGGSSWSIQNTNDMWLQVWGTITTAGAATPDTYQYWLKQVNIALRAGTSSTDRVDTAVQILNLPQVSSP